MSRRTAARRRYARRRSSSIISSIGSRCSSSCGFRPPRGRDGHHWFTFIGAPGRDYLLEPWLESLYEDLRTPIDVVIHQGRREPPRARRFTSHFANQPLAVDPAYLGALSSKLALIVAERNRTVKQRRVATSLGGLRNLLDMDVAHEMAADQGW